MQLFGVASNSVLDRACPIPYSLMDTTFPKSQWLTDMWPMKIQVMGSGTSVYVCKQFCERIQVHSQKVFVSFFGPR